MKKTFYKKWWFWVIIVVVALAILGSNSSSDDNSDGTSNGTSNGNETTTPTVESTNNTEPSNVYKVGDTITANGVKLTFKSVEDDWTGYNEYLGPKDGYKIIRAYFVFENTSSTDKYVGSFDFDCYADGVSVDKYYYGDDTMSSQNLSSGRKLEGYVYFEVPVDAKDIEIEYETSFWTDKKAIFVVE